MAGSMMKIPLEDEGAALKPPDWESFYNSYRKPGYIPGYEILHKLGGGVFGIVYKATKQSIGKAYAIKFLKLDDHSIRQQVMSELETIRLFAQVDHPNLVSIEDMGKVDGIPYIVMGHAGDETLRDRLQEGRLSEEEALRFFVQIARGVQALHDHSLIHFDLKPANLFLKGDMLRVGDYGLSKLISESCMSLTFGRGTPYYMAPEMLQRRGDQRSDIYSLGIIFYECLSAELPFTGENEWEVLNAHAEQELRFPDSIQSPYRRLISAMLAKAPEERPRDIADILQALRAPGQLGESIVLQYGAGTVGSRPSPAPMPRQDAPVVDRRPVPTRVASRVEPPPFQQDTSYLTRSYHRRPRKGLLLIAVMILGALFAMALYFTARSDMTARPAIDARAARRADPMRVRHLPPVKGANSGTGQLGGGTSAKESRSHANGN